MSDHEIEVKFVYKSKKKVIDLLKKLGAKQVEKFSLHDMYFSKKAFSSMKGVREFVRIRRKNDYAELTFKGKRETKSNIWRRMEVNTPIGDTNAMEKILINTGFKKITDGKSNREAWALKNLEIMFIEITYPTKVVFAEIEGPSEDEVQWLLDALGEVITIMDEELFEKVNDDIEVALKPDNK